MPVQRPRRSWQIWSRCAGKLRVDLQELRLRSLRCCKQSLPADARARLSQAVGVVFVATIASLSSFMRDKAGSRHGRLSERYAAVIGRHSGVKQDVEAIRFQPLHEFFSQPTVLEDASRKRDTPCHARTIVKRDFASHGGNGPRETLVETRGHHVRRRILIKVTEKGLPHCRGLDIGQSRSFEVGYAERIGEIFIDRGQSLGIDQSLQPDCGFPLMENPVAAYANGCCHRIEQPAAGTRHRTIETLPDHRRDCVHGLFHQEIMQGRFAEIHGKTRPAYFSEDMAERVAPGFARHLRAAWHSDRLESANTPVAFIIAKQKFTTPDRPVIAEAKAVKCDPEDRALALADAVLGHAARDMGMVMLHFDEWQISIARDLAAEFCR